jgi:hypothetical protein
MFGHDAGHAGLNPDETGVPPVINEWSTQVALQAALQPVVVSNGRVFVTYKTYFQDNTPITAINVADGSKLWEYNFGSVENVGHPSVVGDTVYLQTNQTLGSSQPHVWALNGVNGDVLWASVFDSQWATFWSPIIEGTMVYVNGGEYGGLYGFKTVDGTQAFFNSTLEQYDSWSPAYSGNRLYTFVAGKFREHDPLGGATLWTLDVGWTWSGYSMNTTIAFGSTYAYVIAPPNLVAVNPATKTVAWTANGSYTGTPAVSDGYVYGVSGGNLIARDAVTGTLAFTFVGDLNLIYPPVIANGYAYVSSDLNTYAVQLSTHAKVWSAPVGGWLAIASRRLLVASKDGALHGFVLSP